MKTPLNTAKWIEFFKRNKLNRQEPRWSAPINIPLAARPLLEQSLREFQLGDGGGPASLIAWNVATYRDSQPDLDQVVDLWFEEEKEHSRLLGGLLQRYGVEPIEEHWSFSLFCGLRRLLGVRFELQILTLTELSSTAYYSLLMRNCEDPGLRDVCSLILRDEAGHVAFQNDRLHCAGAPGTDFGRWLWRTQFVLCGTGAATVLWLSHGKCLRALGVTTRKFYQETWRHFGRFLRKLDLRQRLAQAALKRAPASPRQRHAVEPAPAPCLHPVG